MDTNIAERVLRETDDFRGAKHLVEVEGFSSPKVCNLLNRLVGSMDAHEHYLEIGTWKGRTLLSAAFRNTGRLCIGCDKFRLWGKYTGWGHLAKQSIDASIERYAGQTAEIRLFAVPARRLFARRLVPAPVGVYFYDGGHTYRGTRRGIEAVASLLSRRAVVVVDDWNDPVIRRASFDAIRARGLDISWHRHLLGNHDEEGFWNGVGIFYVESRS